MASTVDNNPLLRSVGGSSDQTASASPTRVGLSLANLVATQKAIEVYKELRDRAVDYVNASLFIGETIVINTDSTNAKEIRVVLLQTFKKFKDLNTHTLETIHSLMCDEFEKQWNGIERKSLSGKHSTDTLTPIHQMNLKVLMLEESFKLKALEACISKLNFNREAASKAASDAKIKYIDAKRALGILEANSRRSSGISVGQSSPRSPSEDSVKPSALKRLSQTIQSAVVATADLLTPTDETSAFY